ncbi:MAG TPA: hypothetical protein VEW46_09690 [Pyrinomonadaceae bacterium]|nr:hypothetical protein [Pyrinomonadaceae bacterium]
MALKAYDKIKHAVRWWLLRRLPACKQIVKVISESMERKLSLRERITVKLHLWICLWCVWYLEHLNLMRDTIRTKASQEPNPESSSLPPLSAEARERMKLRLSQPND